jgi:hypothetical protein
MICGAAVKTLLFFAKRKVNKRNDPPGDALNKTTRSGKLFFEPFFFPIQL